MCHFIFVRTHQRARQWLIVACAFSEMNETKRNKIFGQFCCLYHFILAMKVVFLQRRNKETLSHRDAIQIVQTLHSLSSTNDQKPKSFRFHLAFCFCFAFILLATTHDVEKLFPRFQLSIYADQHTRSHSHRLLGSFS